MIPRLSLASLEKLCGRKLGRERIGTAFLDQALLNLHLQQILKLRVASINYGGSEMEFRKDDDERSGWLREHEKQLNPIHIVDTMPDFHYDSNLKSMYLDVVKPTEDQRLNRSTKTGLLLRDNETIHGPCTLSTTGIKGAQVAPLYKFTNRGAHAYANLSKSWDDLSKSTPKVQIPEHVSRPSHILTTSDIPGTCPRPKNMKVGDEARNTNPVDPQYFLPSYAEPFIPVPKFVKNSLDVGDIEGTRPSSSQRRGVGRSPLNVIDIEGTRPGWKSYHRRLCGRDLSLTVEDINGPIEERVRRPSTSEVYRDIEGSHSRDLSRSRRPGTPHTLSLRNDDIEGADAGSGSWEGKTRRRREFAKTHGVCIKSQSADDGVLYKSITRLQEQLRHKGLQLSDISASFHQLDRQNSGKLDMDEVTRAFKTLQLDVGATELNAISRAFVHPLGDGYLDYGKLLRNLVPGLPERPDTRWTGSENMSRAINQEFKSSTCHKPCYDPAWAADLVSSRESRVHEGEKGTQFQAFSGGRPIYHSKYLRNPVSSQTTRTDEGPHIQHQITADKFSASGNFSHQSSSQRPLHHEPEGNCVAREVPVLSVLPDPRVDPAWTNSSTVFEGITERTAEKTRARKDPIFSELKLSDLQESHAKSEPIFFEMHGKSESGRTLPIGGPFWPGVPEVHAENIALPTPRTPKPGPLPMGVPFWTGVERPQSAPRISLRRDYPVPPIFSETSSEVMLRKCGRIERTVRTWADRLGDGAAAFTFVGEGDKILSRPGLQGASFIRPTSDVLPHEQRHPSVCDGSSSNSYQLHPNTKLVSSLAHSNIGRQIASIDRERPQTVNSITRGSPDENLFSTIRCRSRGNSALKRPSTAQSDASSACSRVTFAPDLTRPCTPCSRPVSANRSVCSEFLPGNLSARIRVQSQLLRLSSHGRSGNHDFSGRTIPVSEQRLRERRREEMESVRLLM